MVLKRNLRIAIFNTDIPVPNVLGVRGQYSDIFEGLLRAAATTLPDWKNAELEFPAYEVLKGSLPSDEDLVGLDGIIITGSAASAYDSDPWIAALGEFLYYIYHKHPRIHIFGSCFGHQIVCQALLTPSPSPSCVSQDPSGWELGIQPINLSPAFLDAFGPVTSPLARSSSKTSQKPTQLRLQFVHHDHVTIHSLPNSALPPGWHSIGSTVHCALQGVYQKGRVLTYQGHFEFDEFVNSETLKVFGPLAGWGPEEVDKVVETTKGEDDSIWAAEVVMQFLGEGCDAEGEKKEEKDMIAVGIMGVVREDQGCAREVEVEMEALRAEERVEQTVM